MRFPTLAAAGIAALVLASTASAGPYTLSSTATASGPSPFTGCTADNVALQESELGSTLYPNAEPEPRADVNPTDSSNIVGAYQQDRWSDGGARGLVASWSKDSQRCWFTKAVSSCRTWRKSTSVWMNWKERCASTESAATTMLHSLCWRWMARSVV